MTRGMPADSQHFSRFPVGTDSPGPELNVAYYKSILRREWRLIAILSLIVVSLATIYVLVATPKFTASAALMIDTRRNQLLEAQQVVTDQALDTSGVESQVEVLKSESVALVIIRRLKLATNSDFMKRGALSAFIPGFLSGGGAIPSDFERERTAVNIFSRDLTVKRVGLTYVIDIDFTTVSPVLSAQVANAIIDTYIENEIDARFEATNRATNWLQVRMKELRQQANDSELAVQRYRSENTIVDTGRGLLSEQQVADVSSQLVLVQAATSEAKAKLDRVDAIAKMDLPDDTVTDALKNDVITRLRAQYLDLSARAADFGTRYGERHEATVHIREQMRQIKLSIKDEIRRIAQTYKSDYEIARSRELSLEDSLSKMVSAAGNEGEVAVKLHDLESSAQSYRNLYDSFFQKFTESAQQKTFPVSDARLITAATAPTSKSSPKPMILLPVSLLLGFLIGCTAAIGRERSDTAFRSISQVELLTGVNCLGFLPKVKDGRFGLSKYEDGHTLGDPRQITSRSDEFRYVLMSPFSRFAETVRSIKVAIDIAGLSRSTRIIGVVSALSNEGKSTTAANLALLIAKTNKNVLLMDCDLRNPSLTSLLTPSAPAGLLEVLDKSRPFQDVVCSDASTGLDFVPAVLNGPVSDTSELLSSKVMAEMLKTASEHYSYIVLDLPPLASVVDVKAMGHLIDGFVCVVEWGRTSRDTVLAALKSSDVVRDKMIGIVLNKASEGALRREESSRGAYRSSNYYFDGPQKA